MLLISLGDQALHKIHLNYSVPRNAYTSRVHSIVQEEAMVISQELYNGTKSVGLILRTITKHGNLEVINHITKTGSDSEMNI